MRGTFGLAVLVAFISAGCAAPPAADEVTELGGAHDGAHEVDLPPWVARLELDRAIAQGDLRHQPTAVEGGVTLSPPTGMSTLIGSDGANVSLGDGSLRLGVVAVGREGDAVALTDVEPTIVGAEVQRRLAPGVTEWWRSLPMGLEHGVTLEKRPNGHGPLTIEVLVEGLSARGSEHDDNGVVFTAGEEGAQVASYSHLAVVDAEGLLVPATMSVVDGNILIEVQDADAVYPLIVDPLLVMLEITLNQASAINGDEAGSSVAISADGTRAIVGVPNDAPIDTTAWIRPGTARIFRRDSGGWVEEQMLVPAGALSGESVGMSVAISADGSRVLLGAPHTCLLRVSDCPPNMADPSEQRNSGRAYVFRRVGTTTTWIEEATLLPETPRPLALFGWAVSLSDDGGRAIVGARDDNTVHGVEGGSAGIFFRSGTTWTRDQTIMPGTGTAEGDGEALERFGASVAISGDGERVIVGARLDNIGTPPAPAPAWGSGWEGSARVFVRGATSWTQEAILRSAAPQQNAQFGYSVALTRNGDRAIVGARFDRRSVSQGGTAEIYRRSPTNIWTQEALLEMSTPVVDEVFGTSVAIAADGSRAIVGASAHAHLNTNTGTAWVYVRTSTSWANETAVLSPAPGEDDRFGHSVSMTADGTRVIVGAPREEPSSAASVHDNQGGAHIFVVGTPLAANGTSCSADSECTSDECVDTFCCESACGGGVSSDCQACAASATGGMNGQCRAVTMDTVCRAGPDDCDVAELCNGSDLTCPDDAFEPDTVPCRAAELGGCDVREMCPGDDASCPDDIVEDSGTVCRPAVGSGCDMAEICDGAANTCPDDVLRPAGDTCRVAAGLCDVAETCSGGSTNCPGDRMLAGGTICRDVVGSCDVAETCSGSGAACPLDGVASSSMICRSSVGECDVAEACDGRATSCPPNAYAGSSTVCRGATSVCDVAESCGGTSPSCPTDMVAADGTTCADSLVCNGDEVCGSGSCQMAMAPSCDDSNLCTSDMCAEPGGCASAPVAGCCNIDDDCDDGSVCTVNACSGPGGTCSASPITGCCLADGDCDDMNVCTAESCDLGTNRCVHTPVAGCCGSDTDCSDSNACTADTCDIGTGTCTNAEIVDCCLTDGDCDDTNTCTMDACDASTNTCTNDLLAGCCLTDAECGDGDMCTADTCSAVTAACVNDEIPGCCAEDADCDDADECTTNRCDGVTSSCVFEDIMGCGDIDGGVPTDAGVDAGDSLDAGVPDDASTARDAAASGDASFADAGTDPIDGGCGCRVTAPSGVPIGWLGLLGALVFIRRRR